MSGAEEAAVLFRHQLAKLTATATARADLTSRQECPAESCFTARTMYLLNMDACQSALLFKTRLFSPFTTSQQQELMLSALSAGEHKQLRPV